MKIRFLTKWVVFCTVGLGIHACASSRVTMGKLSVQNQCIAVLPFNVRLDMGNSNEMLSEFVALDLYAQGAMGVVGPKEIRKMFDQVDEPLPPTIDPYWAGELGKKLETDSILFGSLARFPVHVDSGSADGKGSDRVYVNIDAILMNPKTGTVQWAFGAQDTVASEAYADQLEKYSKEIVYSLVGDPREKFGKSGCWKTPVVAQKGSKTRSKRKVAVIAKSPRATKSVVPLNRQQKKVLATLRSSKPIVFKAESFVGRSLKLTKKALPMLHDLARIMSERQAPKKLRIVGHIDAGRSASSDVTLSKARAESIRVYLESLGVNKARLDVLGKGSAKPLFPNINERSRAMNRRVEILAVRRPTR